MFEGSDDDDFSFIDDEFLKDAFEPVDPGQAPKKEVKKEIKEKIISKADRPNCAISINKSDLKEKNLSGLGNNGSVSSVRLRSDDKRSVDNSKDVDFEFDGFFDDFDAGDFDSENAQNTPPDSVFTGTVDLQPKDQTRHERDPNRAAAASANYREKILQTLQMSKSKNNDGSSNNILKHSDAAISSVSVVDKRKSNSSQDLFEDTGSIDNGSKDVNFELDGFFNDDFDADDFGSTNAQNTPPDSVFTSTVNPQLKDQTHCEKDSNRAAPADADFRARILQTLQINKPKNNDSSSSNLKRISDATISSVCIGDKRKRDSSQDMFLSSPDLSNKKRISPVNYAQEVYPHQDSQSSSFVSTPVKPAPAIVTKSLSPGGPLIQKRKFPGPAGILPKLGTRNVPTSVQQIHEEDKDPSFSKDIICSQSSADEFNRGPWRKMLEDLKQEQYCQTSPLSVFNIKWILRRAGLRGQAGVRKVPFLAVMVCSIDNSPGDATVSLKDQTGEMGGTIVSSVLEEYSHTLHPGCTFVLKDVTLLSPVSLKSSVGRGESNRRFYLNITLATILTIYSSDDSGHVIKTSVSKFDLTKLLKQATASKITTAPRAIVEEEEDELHDESHGQKQQLFHTVNTSGSPQFQPNNYQNVNFRTPRPNVGYVHQPQQPRFRSPVNNNLRMPSHPAGSNPRTGLLNSTSNFSSQNRSTLLPRPGSSNRFLRPQGFQSPALQPSTPNRCISSQGSVKAFSPAAQTSKATLDASRQSSSVIASNMICSQQEEKEVKDILEGVDTDSLFGDF